MNVLIDLNGVLLRKNKRFQNWAEYLVRALTHAQFTVTIWSSKMRKTILRIPTASVYMAELLSTAITREYCTDHPQAGTNGIPTWGVQKLLPIDKGPIRYDTNNTIIIDDELYKVEDNPRNSYIIFQQTSRVNIKLFVQTVVAFSRLKTGNFLIYVMSEQRSPNWFLQRRGRVTGSRAAAYIDPNHPFKTLDEVIAETNGTLITEPNADMERGVRLEPVALEKYALTLQPGERLIQVGMVIPTWNPKLGYSPDGLVLNYLGQIIRLVEVKCPRRFGPMWKNHQTQMIMGLYIFGLTTCDYVQYVEGYDIEVTPFCPVQEEIYRTIAEVEHIYLENIERIVPPTDLVDVILSPCPNLS